MKAQEIRNKSTEELMKELVALCKELFSLRMQKVLGEVAQSHLFKKIRRDIARIKTILREKEGF